LLAGARGVMAPSADEARIERLRCQGVPQDLDESGVPALAGFW